MISIARIKKRIQAIYQTCCEGDHRGVKKALFFPHCAFLWSYSWAILPQKAFAWKENDSFFPPR